MAKKKFIIATIATGSLMAAGGILYSFFRKAGKVSIQLGILDMLGKQVSPTNLSASGTYTVWFTATSSQAAPLNVGADGYVGPTSDPTSLFISHGIQWSPNPGESKTWKTNFKVPASTIGLAGVITAFVVDSNGKTLAKQNVTVKVVSTPAPEPVVTHAVTVALAVS